MSLPYFRKWVDNWLASPSVREMTLAQRGLFDHMLCVSWQRGPLPPEVTPLVRVLNVHRLTFGKLWVYPLVDCWKLTSKGLVNERLEEEREWAKSKTIKAVKAARKRWNKHADAMQTHLQTHPPSICHPDPDPDPDLYKEKEKKKKERPSSPKYPIAWNSKEKDFEGGGLEFLKSHLKSRYDSVLGRKWQIAVYESIREWAEDNPDKAEEKNRLEAQANSKGWGLAILSWYNREAKKERQYKK